MRNPRASYRRGFTLIELMVAIGVIALLAAIALPLLGRARRAARVTATASTIQTVSMALVAYEQDFSALPPAWMEDQFSAGIQQRGRPGFAALGLSLVGPGGKATFNNANQMVTPSAPAFVSNRPYFIGDCISTGTSEYVAINDVPPGLTSPRIPQDWARLWYTVSQTQTEYYYSDDKDGPGVIGANNKPYGPYLQPDKVKMHGCAILDSWERPIAYFPVHVKNSNIRKTIAGASAKSFGAYCDRSILCRYNSDDNLYLFLRTNESISNGTDVTRATRRVQAMLGDTTTGNDNWPPDGYINGKEIPVEGRAFLLWSGGPDEKFGPELNGQSVGPTNGRGPYDKEISACDDVTNFR